jgi:hypothetical protein
MKIVSVLRALLWNWDFERIWIYNAYVDGAEEKIRSVLE